jgi:acyl carrier protein
MSARQTLRTFILENYLFTDDATALADGDSFLQKGILDSTGIMEVIFFIEEQFGIKVEDEEMIPDNLDSIDHLVAFIERKKG